VEARVIVPKGIELPDGRAIAVAIAAGARASVAWEDGALVLRGTFAPDAGGDATIALTVRHPFARARHVWVPHLTPAPENVAADAVFRAPAVLVADDALALALVPDVDDVATAHGWRAWLDYDHAVRTVTLAAGAFRLEGHVFYAREPLAGERAARAAEKALVLRLHVLASAHAEDLENPYGLVARFVWARWGRPRFLARRPRPLAPMLAHVARWAFAPEGWAESVWQSVTLAPEDDARGAHGTPRESAPPMGAPVFIVDVTRHPSVPLAKRTWREPRSIWNQAWFSTQRAANGLLRYARQTGQDDLALRARQMTEIALAAPQADGLFPALLVADDEGRWRWSNSDRRPPSASARACHLASAAFTARMLLEWHALTGDARAGACAVRFANRLVRLQRPSGAFPGWVEPDGRVPDALAEGPESAVGAALLFELDLPGPALATLRFLEGIAGEGRWEDFETYYSCAPWGAPELLGKRVVRNGIFKQNTLSIAWSAEAFFLAWRKTGDARHLALARRCLDELSLYQAVWDPPFLPAPALGGFGVMNADSEWNDARQSLFAPLYLAVGKATGDAELTERGIAAVRASFSMLYAPENPELVRAYEARFPFFGPETYGFMMENQGHGAADPIGTFTIYTWGNGSALATAAAVRDRFPEVQGACGLA
jgi:hypothetical protein